MKVAYNHKIFQELNDFPVAKQLLKENQEKLTELGDILCYYELHEKGGISLLHQHFPLDSNERLVEEFDGNRSYLKPQVEEDKDDVTPYLWKVEPDPESGEWRYYPLEFVRHPSIGAEVRKQAEAIFSHQEFLADVTAKLSELGLTDTFGLAIPHRDTIKLKKGEILVETTDEQTRTLTCSPALISSIAPGELTQTLWKFTPRQDVDVLGQCVMHCNSHCHGHCRGHS
jgi:hypothetical protein